LKERQKYRKLFRRKPLFLPKKPGSFGEKPPVNSELIPQREKEKKKEREKKGKRNKRKK
jgi:hypothetical protein